MMGLIKKLFGKKEDVKTVEKIQEVSNYKIEIELNSILINATKMKFEILINNDKTIMNDRTITTYEGKEYLISKELKKEIEMIEKFNKKEISLLDVLSSLGVKDIVKYKNINLYSSLMGVKHHKKTKTNLNKNGLILF